MKLSALSSALLVALSFSGSAYAEVQVDRLENVRDLMTFNPLSDQEKVELFDQASLLINDIYVNKEQKNNYYGVSPTYAGHVDPDEAMAKIKAKLADLSTEEFYKELHLTFASQRDLHLTYVFPFPYRAFTSFLPLTMTRMEGNEVRISTLSDQYLTGDYLNGQLAPSVGDVLVAYNGKTVEQILKEKQTVAQGSNNYGGFVRALSLLTRAPQSTKLAPEQNEAVLTLKREATGETYDVTLPWLVTWDDAALAAAPQNAVADIPTVADLAIAKDSYQEKVNKLNKQFGMQQASYFDLNPTGEPILNWAIIPKDGKKVGYMKLDSFVPVNGPEKMIGELINLIHYKMADTDSLIIDVRDNPGGYILIADIMSQMFIPGKAEVGDFKIVNSDVNKPIVDFLAQYDLNVDMSNGGKYSNLFQFTSDEVANSIGQLYYNPVAVLSNAKSYSAGDMFTCAMQDNGAAVVYGEDPQTGAGGANVFRHDFLSSVIGGDFKPLPDSSNITVSWGQALREKYYKNNLIEDYGCTASVDVSLEPMDLKTGNKGQFDKIMTDLLSKPAPRSYYKINGNNDRVLPMPKQAPSLSLQVKNVEHVALYVNGQLFNKKSVYAYGPEKTVVLPLVDGMQSGDTYELTVVGLDGGNQPLWNTKRIVVTQGSVYENNTSYPIPDANSGGVTSTIDVTESGTPGKVKVSVDISHTYIADLRVTLTSPAGTEFVIHNNDGGAGDDIVKTVEFDTGSEDVAGVWSLKAVDRIGFDTGTINSWKLAL
ncbi:S41 family peptidase [Veronia pacifica]|uniref:P/Homo B domain-containing protein n=1 Tax=Veronia pacifica TaxID=1080227 RepID=A0A1C3EAI4_9GAMM|nr:S41 family peptidase [Veronia pacifica]ODA30256.1 hypothetical protein A8L45_20510 [Veronia pacifica]